MVDLRQLETVVAVVDAGSFTGAADVLGVAQPTVSQAVRALEAELGVPLFDRLRSGAVPTAAGRALVDPARQALRDAATARQAVASVAGLVAGTLDLVCLPTLAVTPVAELIGRLRVDHDGVVVRLAQPESADDVLDRVRDARAEIGFTELTAAVLADDGLVAHELARQDFVALVPADGARRGPVGVDELARLPIITTPPGTSTRRQLDEALAEVGDRPDVVVETDHREAIVALVAAGAGVALVPAEVAGVEPPPGTTTRPLSPRVRRRVGAVHRPGPLAPAADALLRLAVPSWPSRRRRPRPRRG